MAEPAEKIEARDVAVVTKSELVAGHSVSPIIPRTIDEVARIANAVIYAGLSPDSYKGQSAEETRSRIIIGIMKGAEIGVPPLTALANIAIINNRPCVWGDLAIALVQQSGKLLKMETEWGGLPGADDRVCTVSIWRVGQDAPYVGAFGLSDAKRARLTGKGPWVAYPDRMLFNRARAFAIRDGFADCLAGLAIAEEMHDVPAAPPPVPDQLLDDTPPAITDQTEPDAERKPTTEPGMLEDITPSDWEVVAEDLAKQYSDTFPTDRHDFMTDHAEQLSDMLKADPDSHRLFMKKTGQS